MPKSTEPVVRTHGDGRRRDRTTVTETHPAYGVATIHRIQGSTHHWREYTGWELAELIMLAFYSSGFRFQAGHVLSYFKDAAGGWWEPFDPSRHARKFALVLTTTTALMDDILVQISKTIPNGRTPG